MLTFSINKNLTEAVASGALSFDMPTTDIGRAWLSEVVVKALDDKTDAEVNVDAYGYACEKNQTMAVGAREVALLSVEEIQMGQRGVADTVANYLDLNIDMIVESSEVRTLVYEFLNVHETIMIEEGQNLWKIISLAKQANAKMTEKLIDIIKRHDISDLVNGVLSNRECLGVLEGHFA